MNCPDCGSLNFYFVPAFSGCHDEPPHAAFYECSFCGAVVDAEHDEGSEADYRLELMKEGAT